MLKITTQQKKILDNLRNIDASLERLKISSITVYKNTKSIRFNLICDKAVSDEIKKQIELKIDELVPERFNGIEVSVKKVVAEENLVQKTVYDYVKDNYLSLSQSVNLSDITVGKEDGYITINLRLEEDAIDYFEINDADEEIIDYLGTIFCDSFKITYENKGYTPADKELLELKLTTSDFKRIVFRTFKVTEVTKYVDNDKTIGELNDTAVYVADVKKDFGAVSIAGKITSIKRFETKKSKPYFVIELFDKTGRITGRIFPHKDQVDKIAKLEVGFEIITKGKVGSYKDYLDFQIVSVNLCKLPKNFVPVEKPSRAVPSEYVHVFPEKLEISTQDDMFSDNGYVPECLIGKKIVVFDLETTGLDCYAGDKITEIGAVLIEDGVIKSKFWTFVNPEREISQKIMELTGITYDMVKDYPVIEDVFGDFYKFVDGAVLVAHNSAFDVGFMRYFAKQFDYVLYNEVMDTMELAHEQLPSLKNFKLNTIADYFNFQFEHHRAWNDAFVTAKIFIELIKLKKCLPNL